MPGTLSFVLHAHMPYVKKHGVWPHGEEWVFEVLAETYIPLINTIYRLHEEGIKAKLTINVTPILLEQLADNYMKNRFEEYVKTRIDSAEGDIKRFQRKKEFQKLAEMYYNYYVSIYESFRKYNRDIPGALKDLQDKGLIEAISCSATHAYLPLLLEDSWIYFQIKVGIETYKKYFKKRPRGIWLPEMGYRPRGSWEGPNGHKKEYRKGIEEFLEEFGLEYFFVDAHAIQGRKVRVMFSGGEFVENEPSWKPRGSVYRAYRVKSSRIYVLGRNLETALQVWSREIGYPGDPWYREFHKLDEISGMHYWRITNKNVPLDGKRVYNVEMAQERVKVHATHFVSLVRNLLRDKDEESIVVAPYDAELFGHWWFEGINWLESVIRLLNEDSDISLRTITEYLDAYPPEREIELPESSWGYGGKHMTWWNEETLDYWKKEYDAERKALEIKSYIKYKNGRKKHIIQAFRELLLLQSSDWTFLIFTKQAADYAKDRYEKHYRRFIELYNAITKGIEITDRDMFLEDDPFDNEIIEDAILSS